MEINKIIKLVARLLNDDEVLTAIEYSKANELTLTNLLGLLGETNKPSCLTQSVVDNLRLILDCINITSETIASDYVAVFNSEVISVEDEYFSLDTLSQKLVKVKEILSDKGNKVPYQIIENNLFVDKGNYIITYSYLPEEKTFDENINSFSSKLSITCFCYKVLNEYCTIKGAIEESIFWENKFITSLKNSSKKLSSIMIKNRRWL